MSYLIISYVGVFDYVTFCVLRLKLITLANEIETNPGPSFEHATRDMQSMVMLQEDSVQPSPFLHFCFHKASNLNFGQPPKLITL